MSVRSCPAALLRPPAVDLIEIHHVYRRRAPTLDRFCVLGLPSTADNDDFTQSAGRRKNLGLPRAPSHERIAKATAAPTGRPTRTLPVQRTGTLSFQKTKTSAMPPTMIPNRNAPLISRQVIRYAMSA
jgi:hypothetical protein